ncbi:WapI family immunity protein [Hymenobacter psychrophilus]
MPDEVQEESFTLAGESGIFFRITFAEVYNFPESTCAWGSYEMRAIVEIKSDGFAVTSTLHTSTGELFQLFQHLRSCQAAVAGIARYESYEHHLAHFLPDNGPGGYRRQIFGLLQYA